MKSPDGIDHTFPTKKRCATRLKVLQGFRFIYKPRSWFVCKVGFTHSWTDICGKVSSTYQREVHVFVRLLATQGFALAELAELSLDKAQFWYMPLQPDHG
jgi:hypothetical protein